MRLKTFAALSAALALTACFGGGGPDQLLTLTPSQVRPPAQPMTAAQGSSIVISDPGVPQALRTNRVPVYVDETTIQYLKDAAWVEYPGPLFARLLGETISVRTGRVVLDARQSARDAGMRITGHLSRFGLDPSAMEAVVTYDATIARQGGGVTTNRFEARVGVGDDTVAAVAPALNQAANQVAEQVAVWISSG